MKRYYYIVYEFTRESGGRTNKMSDLIDMKPFEWLVNTAEKGQILTIVYSEEITKKEYYEYAEFINRMI